MTHNETQNRKHTMSLTDQRLGDIHLEASRAAYSLRARAKQLSRAHNDRIKRLETFMRQLAAADSKGSELPGVSGISISPDIEGLIANPFGGLE